MKINEKLENFLTEISKKHSPFKREVDNKRYQEKYIAIFKVIFQKLTSIDSSVQIHRDNFQDTYRNYKQVLFDLYNDSLIFFLYSKNKSLLHGNKGFSQENKRNYKAGSFTSFYKLDDTLINQIKDNYNFKYTIRNNKINKTNKIYKNKTLYKQMNVTPTFTENKWYSYLTYENGDKFMEELPHYGEYEDGRIYSKFHTLKREIRENLRLCGDKIIEIFDISHCYPTLLGVLIENKMSESVIKEYRKYIMNNDIYMDALQETELVKNKENRNKIKPYFNKFILSTIKDIKRNMKWEDKTNDPILFSGVVNFFKNKFPEIFEFIYNYEVSEKNVNGRIKKVKNLAHDLQKIEKIIIDKLTSKLTIPFLTLHDAIYIKESDLNKINFDLEKEFIKILNF